MREAQRIQPGPKFVKRNMYVGFNNNHQRLGRLPKINRGKLPTPVEVTTPATTRGTVFEFMMI